MSYQSLARTVSLRERSAIATFAKTSLRSIMVGAIIVFLWLIYIILKATPFVRLNVAIHCDMLRLIAWAGWKREGAS